MIKRRLKYQYLLMFIGIFVILPLLSLAILANADLIAISEEPEVVNEEVIDNSLPVVNITTKVIKPYTDAGVKIAKSYYDYMGEEKDQINSISIYDNTYIQNTGIDYTCENEFDVVAILEGTVESVKEDELLGNIVEIKHENGYVSIYQSLKEVSVKKGDIVSQGQVIGKSGENEFDKALGNHLHCEIYENGQSVNPENYFDKEVSTKKEN